MKKEIVKYKEIYKTDCNIQLAVDEAKGKVLFMFRIQNDPR